MTMRKILEYPHPRLRIKAAPVTDFGAKTQEQINDLIETMYGTPNTAGLAATQIDIHLQMIAIDLSDKKNELLLLINPVLAWHSAETCYNPEACLSVPGDIYEPVKRYTQIKIESLDRDGQRFELECDGFLAICIQHEMDHLQGTLFIDHVSKLKRARIDKKLEKLRKLEAA